MYLNLYNNKDKHAVNTNVFTAVRRINYCIPLLKDGFPLIFGYFSLSKRQTALWLFIQY